MKAIIKCTVQQTLSQEPAPRFIVRPVWKLTKKRVYIGNEKMHDIHDRRTGLLIRRTRHTEFRVMILLAKNFPLGRGVTQSDLEDIYIRGRAIHPDNPLTGYVDQVRHGAPLCYVLPDGGVKANA